MARSAIIAFIVVLSAAYCIGQPGRQCSDPNAVWNNCSRCELICPLPGTLRTCAPICVAKCTCKSGYILGPAGRCISLDECFRRTRCMGPSQVWNDCGSDCEPTCIPPPQPRMCPAVCVARCTCAPGYIRGPSGDCITTANCANLKRCGQNEIWSNCGNNCEPSCVAIPRPTCSHTCVPKCMCRPGFVRARNGRCVLRSQCNSC